MTTARRLLLAFTLIAGAALAHGAAPASAQLLTERPIAGLGDGDGESGDGLGSLICGYGRQQLCSQESVTSCAEWGVRRKVNITLTGLGIEYEQYCLSQRTTVRYFYRDV